MLNDRQSHEEYEGSKNTYWSLTLFCDFLTRFSVNCSLGHPPPGTVCGRLGRVYGLRRHGVCWPLIPVFLDTRGGGGSYGRNRLLGTALVPFVMHPLLGFYSARSTDRDRWDCQDDWE